MNIDRRSFLRSTAAAGVALATGGSAAASGLPKLFKPGNPLGKSLLVVGNGERVFLDRSYDKVIIKDGSVIGCAPGISIGEIVMHGGSCFFGNETMLPGGVSLESGETATLDELHFTQQLLDDSVLPPDFMRDYFSERVKEEFNLG